MSVQVLGRILVVKVLLIRSWDTGLLKPHLSVAIKNSPVNRIWAVGWGIMPMGRCVTGGLCKIPFLLVDHSIKGVFIYGDGSDGASAACHKDYKRKSAGAWYAGSKSRYFLYLLHNKLDSIRRPGVGSCVWGLFNTTIHDHFDFPILFWRLERLAARRTIVL